MAQIETWKPQYTKYFEALNRGWIVRFFDENTIEPFEVELLSNPKKEILDKGGHLFFATEDGFVLGCVALLKHGETEYEISKLAVDPSAQGKGVANQLFDAIFSYAKTNNISKLILETNTKLKAAMGLYNKYGFSEVKDFTPHYTRVNIKFKKFLN